MPAEGFCVAKESLSTEEQIYTKKMNTVLNGFPCFT